MDQPYDGRRAARHRLIGDQDVLRLALQSLTDERLERQAAKHMRLAPPVASKFSTTFRPESPRNLAAVVRAVVAGAPDCDECGKFAPHQAAEAEPDAHVQIGSCMDGQSARCPVRTGPAKTFGAEMLGWST